MSKRKPSLIINLAVLQTDYINGRLKTLDKFRSDQSSNSFALLDEDFFLLQTKAEDVLLDTVGLGRKMQEAFERHGEGMSSSVLWKALQPKR